MADNVDSSMVAKHEPLSIIINAFCPFIFKYCCVIWHFCSRNATFKEDNLQKKALRFAMLELTMSYWQLLRLCGESTL